MFRCYLRFTFLEKCPIIKATVDRECCKVGGVRLGSGGFNSHGIAIVATILENNLIPSENVSSSIVEGFWRSPAEPRHPEKSESHCNKKGRACHDECLMTIQDLSLKFRASVWS